MPAVSLGAPRAAKVVRAFPRLKFDPPLLLVRCQALSRPFVGEQAGVLYSFADTPEAEADLFFDLRRELKSIHLHPGAQEVEAVYGLAFHPDFETNHQCSVCYTQKASDPRQRNLVDGTRVSRFTVLAAVPPRIDPASEEIVLTFLHGGHNGGDLDFTADGRALTGLLVRRDEHAVVLRDSPRRPDRPRGRRRVAIRARPRVADARRPVGPG